MGPRLGHPSSAAEPLPELVRTLCARAGLRLDPEDVDAVAAMLEAHGEAISLVRSLDLPDGDIATFDPAWR